MYTLQLTSTDWLKTESARKGGNGSAVFLPQNNRPIEDITIAPVIVGNGSAVS
ncbi:hypothetical protein QUA20_03025 [Microcoleus sp. Pol7_A1]|uniref:hypothetical protein n=1 Tax=Microcoleus sp. Pol7_A1 TaxID=2818893 RepID=UPI002FD557B3